MEKLKVIWLDWPSTPPPEVLIRCANGLSDKASLSVILPHLNNAQNSEDSPVTGLDSINLSDIPDDVSNSKPLPWSDAPYIRNQIPLYGYPSHESHQKIDNYSVHQTRRKKKTDHLPKQKPSKEDSNIFYPDNFSSLKVNSQIIAFSRFACRLKAKEEFDVIYSSDWRTYLAGSELKRISRKHLVVQVNTLSTMGNGSDVHGWRYELEKKAFASADAIIAANTKISKALEKVYAIPRKCIYLPGEKPSIPRLEPPEVKSFVGIIESLSNGKRELKVNGEPATHVQG